MDPDEVQQILDNANDLLEAGRPAEALRSLETLEEVTLDADDRIEAGAIRAWAFSELNRTDEALQVLEPLLDEFPETARLLSALGVVLSNGGDLGVACDVLRRAVELDSSDEVALANLGLVYEKLRESDLALAVYDKAINLGAEIDWLLKRKAAVLAEMGRLPEARTALKRYLSLAPEDAEQWIGLAILHSDEMEFDQAFHCYRAAEQIAPDSASLRLNWGVTAVRARRVDTAERQLAYLMRLEPGSSRPLLLEAYIAEQQGNLQDATQKYVDALARVQRTDYEELTYALEMAMDFFSRRGMRDPCDQLLEQAYIANACTVELCEAYRDIAGAIVPQANWYSVVVEGDYRAGLEEVLEPGEDNEEPPTRFLRNYQLLATDHDEAIALATEFAERMGEANIIVREFVSEEPIEDAHIGIYEVDRESLVFADDSPG